MFWIVVSCVAAAVWFGILAIGYTFRR